MRRLSFLDLIREDLERVEVLLHERPAGQNEVVSQAVDLLVDGGGKRLRPALVMLSAHLCNADVEQALPVAAAVELLHTATLIHDDLIDGASVRRGIETLSSRWSSGATVLTGDYVFARAAHLASQSESVCLMQRFAETLMTICNGEVQQMFDGQNGQASYQDYEQRIQAKTASLFSMAAQAGAILAGSGEEDQAALQAYGEQLGLAFQIVDDVLDLVADEETLGKPVGGDLRQGLVTLPTLVFLEAEPNHPLVRRVLQGNTSEASIQEAVQSVAGSLAIERALRIALTHAEAAKSALETFPDSAYRAALIDLSDFIVHRHF